jgi:hypothetical protein
VTDIGGTTSISVARPFGAPAYIYGAPTAWMKFPAGILPSAEYTLFYVARYNGATRGRIFNIDNLNWISGFWSGRAGVAQHGSCSWITDTFDVHGLDWVMGVDRSDSFRSNGLDRTINSVTCQNFGRITINTGIHSDASDFAVQSVLVYNRRLSETDVLKVEVWLSSLYLGFTPASLQVCAKFSFISNINMAPFFITLV